MGFGSSSDRKKAESGIQKTGDTLYDRTKQTDAEASQYGSSFDIGKFLQDYFQGQMTGKQAPGTISPEQQYQNQGQLSQGLYNQTLQDVNNPYGAYESTLQPALQQAQEQINSYYQKRGLLNSGLAIGQMGQAGVDLAIKEAQGKMQARQQALSNASLMGNNIYTQNQGSLSNLANLYSTQQSAGLNSMSRQAQGAIGAAGYQGYPYQAQLGNYYGGQAALHALPGQLISAAGSIGAAGLTGGASAAAGGGVTNSGLSSAVSSAIPMCWVASEIFGGWFHPKTIRTRYWINSKAPVWFKNFYIKHGENIALFIKYNPIFKIILKPFFELFAKWGK